MIEQAAQSYVNEDGTLTTDNEAICIVGQA